MELVNLVDICDPKQWKTISKKVISEQGSYPVYGANGKMGYYDKFNHQYPTLLIGCRGTCGSLHITDEFSYTNGNAMSLDNLKDSVDIKYLYYYLSFRGFNDVISGGVQKQITRENLKRVKVPLPSLEVQKAIAARLDKADEIRQLNQQIINHYDELIQALFIDMFGDPVKNEKEWDLLNLKNITLKLGSGSTPKGGKQNYKTSGISLIRSMNVYDAYFSFNDLAFIDEEQAEKLKNVALESGDILFNITGASVCRCTIVPDYILPARVNQHVSIIRVNSDAISNIYLNRLLISKSVKQQLLKIGSGGGAVMEAITKEKLENFDVIVPPIKLQNQFAERVQKIEAQKELAVQALQQSEDLFNSLLQQAFKK